MVDKLLTRPTDDLPMTDQRTIRTAVTIAMVINALLCVGDTLAEPTHPNVLMISIDDLNDWTGFWEAIPKCARLTWMPWRNVDAVSPMPIARSLSAQLHEPASCQESRRRRMAATSLDQVRAATALKAVPTIQRYFKDNGYYTLSGGKVLHHGFNGRLVGAIDRSLGRKRSPRPNQPMNRPSHWSGAWDWGAYPEQDAAMGGPATGEQGGPDS